MFFSFHNHFFTRPLFLNRVFLSDTNMKRWLTFQDLLRLHPFFVTSRIFPAEISTMRLAVTYHCGAGYDRHSVGVKYDPLLKAVTRRVQITSLSGNDKASGNNVQRSGHNRALYRKCYNNITSLQPLSFRISAESRHVPFLCPPHHLLSRIKYSRIHNPLLCICTGTFYAIRKLYQIPYILSIYIFCLNTIKCDSCSLVF